MFYNLIYRSFLWNKDKNRNIKVLVTGTILYIAAYFSLNSQYMNEIELIQKYKKYFYHIIAVDFATTVSQMFFTSPEKPKKRIQKKTKKSKNNRWQLPLLNPNINNELKPVKKELIKPVQPSIPVYADEKVEKQIEEQYNIPIYKPQNQQVNAN